MRNQIFNTGYILAIIIGCIFIGCNESTTVGSNLFEDEDIALSFRNDLEVKAKTINSSRIPTYFNRDFDDENFNSGTYLVGRIEDPVFGSYESFIHFEMSTGGAIDFVGGTLDSMVFIFEYDTLGFYGEPNIKHDITIERVGERMDLQDTLYSDQDFPIVPSFMDIPVASKVGFVPRPMDSVSLVSYLTDEEIQIQPQLRMQMNQNLAQAIFRDTLNNSTTDLLQDVVNGFVLKSIPRDNNSMFGINLSQATQLSSLEVYYLSRDSIKRVAQYIFNEVRHQRFTIENSSAPVSESIDEYVDDGSSLFVQGMNGARIELDVSSLSSIQGKLLNQVQLRIFQNEEFPDDNSKLYPPVDRFILTKATSGDPIEDVNLIFEGFAGERVTGLDFIFGGAIQDSIAGNLSGYNMDITAYAKEVQAGRENGIILLEPFQKISTPRRVILHGPGHSLLSPELRVTFTEE